MDWARLSLITSSKSFKGVVMVLFLLILPFFLLVSASHGRESRSRTPTHRRHVLASRSLPSGWSTYFVTGNDGGGCYVDSWSRLLHSQVSVNDMTVSGCLRAFQAKGFTYARIEYSNEFHESHMIVHADISTFRHRRSHPPMPHRRTAP